MSQFIGNLDPGALRKIGDTSGASVSTGMVGEEIVYIIPSTSAVPLVTDTDATLQAIVIPAGVWTLEMQATFICEPTTVVNCYGVSQAASGGVFSGNNGGLIYSNGSIPTNAVFRRPSLRVVRNLSPSSADTANDIKALARFSAGALSVYGSIKLTRRASA